MLSAFEQINGLVFGPIMVFAVLSAGIFLSVKTRFVQFRYLGYSIKTVCSSVFKKSRSKDGISPFRALATALSGTLGTGNIAGVATAVAIGGAGAVFWMVVSAFLGMAVKYSEIVLAVKYRTETKSGWRGGAMYYISKAVGNKAAAVFAVFCLLASFGVGNMTQSNTAKIALLSIFAFTPAQTGFIFLIICLIIGIVIFGGIKRISGVTTTLVPFMAIFYIGCCFFVLASDITGCLSAVCEIMKSAFNFQSAAGGLAGSLFCRAVRIGFSKGVFTNEAGIGSAPMAHAAADAETPAKQGLWGIFEVFFDTCIMCSMTGIVVVMSGAAQDSVPIPALALAAFKKYLGNGAAVIIAASTIFFALSTIVGWSFYGECAINYLTNESRRALNIYRLIYAGAVYFGAAASIGLVWGMADIFNVLMMLPNIYALMLLSNVVKRETKSLRPTLFRKNKRFKF